MPFAVVVTFEIEDGQMSRFLPLILSNARASLEDESGCQQFDVATDPARPNEVFLYEIYDSAADFESHLHSPHYMAFGLSTANMVVDKEVWTYEKVIQ